MWEEIINCFKQNIQMANFNININIYISISFTTETSLQVLRVALDFTLHWIVVIIVYGLDSNYFHIVSILKDPTGLVITS